MLCKLIHPCLLTHIHTFIPEFSADIDTTISTCIDLNIQKLLLPNIDSSSIEPLANLCKNYPQICYPMVGLHPCSVKENYMEELSTIEPFIRKINAIAIGEIGIDLNT